jgi:hypothetical protein
MAFGITNFQNYRLRALLYAGKPTGTYSPPSRPAESRSASNGMLNPPHEYEAANHAHRVEPATRCRWPVPWIVYVSLQSAASATATRSAARVLVSFSGQNAHRS